MFCVIDSARASKLLVAPPFWREHNIVGPLDIEQNKIPDMFS